MDLRTPRARLLPATIVLMAVTLCAKSGTLIMAAAEAGTVQPDGPATVPPSAAPASTSLAATPPAPQTQPSHQPQPQSSDPPVSAAERSLLLDLRSRHDALDAREKSLDARSAILAAAEAKLKSRVDQLNALQSRLEQLETERRAHDDANWTGLVHVYEAMKPRDAATIFDSLEMQVLLEVLDRMQPRRAAPVLAAMQPDRARLATQMLAELRTRQVTPAPISSAKN